MRSETEKATAGVAVAHKKHERTRADAVLATFTVTQSSVRDKTCTGTDGEYRVPRQVPRTSADPRTPAVIQAGGCGNHDNDRRGGKKKGTRG